MVEYKKGELIHLPIRLEVTGTDVTGVVASDLTVKIANKDSIDWEVLTTPTDFLLEELSEGDYTLVISAGTNDTIGHFRTKVSSVCADTKQFVTFISEELATDVSSNIITGDKVPIDNRSGFRERLGLVSENIIHKTDEFAPRFGVIFTRSTTSSGNDFDTASLVGSVIIPTEGLAFQNQFLVQGGYYFDTVSDTVSSSYGIAKNSLFGIFDGGSTIVNTNWKASDGSSDLNEADGGIASGWTFIISETPLTYPDSDDNLSIWSQATLINTSITGSSNVNIDSVLTGINNNETILNAISADTDEMQTKLDGISGDIDAISVSATDWTTTERMQIRKKIGIEGLSASSTATPDLALEISATSNKNQILAELDVNEIILNTISGDTTQILIDIANNEIILNQISGDTVGVAGVCGDIVTSAGPITGIQVKDIDIDSDNVHIAYKTPNLEIKAVFIPFSQDVVVVSGVEN